MPVSISQLKEYVHDTLGITLALQPWDSSQRLPFFLLERYSYYCTRLYGLNLLLMTDKGTEGQSPAMIRKHMEAVHEKSGYEVVYVHHLVSAYNRKRLIEQGVPFIIPGNQMYCPMLAIDLREHFRQKRQNVRKFSPATQAMLLNWFYSHHFAEERRTTPTEMARTLGYSKMTMSRAFKEVDAVLASTGVNTQNSMGINHAIQDQDLWLRLQPLFRSPVKQRRYLLEDQFNITPRWRAGLTALANYTMLAEPTRAIYAISPEEWKLLKQKKGLMLLDSTDPQAVEVEVWSYAPSLFGRNHTVDPLSLLLSLQGSSDERIESALEELKGCMPW